MEIEVKESVTLKDGKYKGVVSKIEYRTEPYAYTDVYIKEEKTEFELKYGCPTNESTNGKLMKLLAQFTEIKAGMKIDPEKILLGQQVEFMTLQRKEGENIYTNIVADSVKPLVASEDVQ